jgi:hypothetical protein
MNHPSDQDRESATLAEIGAAIAQHETGGTYTDGEQGPDAMHWVAEPANAPTPEDQDWQIIHTYTRAHAIEDGVLRDVTAHAATAGFRVPVALSAAAWADCVAWDEADNDRKGTVQDEAGRLADVLTMTYLAVRRHPGDTDRVRVQLVRTPRPGRTRTARPAELHAVIGPGDQAEPVITIMMVGED